MSWRDTIGSMGRHRAGDAAPSRDWIENALGKRHRLSVFHDPLVEHDRSVLLMLFPTQADVEDYAHRDEAYRNLGTSAALHVIRDVFADYDSYVLRLSEQRVVEHRPMRSDDVLHSDVFIESHVDDDDADIFGLRVVFTDSIGALVFTNFATFVGRLETPVIQVEDETPTEQHDTGLAAGI